MLKLLLLLVFIVALALHIEAIAQAVRDLLSPDQLDPASSERVEEDDAGPEHFQSRE